MERAKGRAEVMPGSLSRARWLLMHARTALRDAQGGESGDTADLIALALRSLDIADNAAAKAQGMRGGGGSRG